MKFTKYLIYFSDPETESCKGILSWCNQDYLWQKSRGITDMLSVSTGQYQSTISIFDKAKTNSEFKGICYVLSYSLKAESWC